MLRELGIKSKPFAPARPFFTTQQNNIDHRKILVIDGIVAFTGGINLADEYMNIVERFGYWKDTGVMLKGEAVRSFTLLFLQMWNVTEKNIEGYSRYLNITIPTPETADGYVMGYGDDPYGKERVGESVYLLMINTATKYLHIVSPYLVIDNVMMSSLKFAAKRGVDVKGFNTAFSGDVPLGAGMSSSAALESTYAYALNDLFGDNKIDKFELAKVGQATEHNYCGVNCGIMDQFASVFGKQGSLIRLDCRSLEYQYFPFDPKGYRLVLVDSVVKHELASSAYNKRRQSCEAAVAAIQKKHPHVEFLRDCTMEMLEESKAEISEEDFMRAEYVIEEIQRVLDVCDALEKGDYETVGQKMYETHHGMSKLYEVSCEELDFLNDLAFDCGVTGSRVMGGGFGGCTINLVKEELYDTFIQNAKDKFKEKFGRSPKVYDVVISDGARRLV